MDIKDRVKTLQDEFLPIQEELKQLLFEVRERLMEAQSPIPNDLERDRLGTLLNQIESEKQNAPGKGVKPDGN